MSVQLSVDISMLTSVRLHAHPPIDRTSFQGSSHPKVAIMGSSHCLMYGGLIASLAVEYGTRIGVLCKDGAKWGRIDSPTTSWDKIRLGYLEKWRPELVVWIDAWAGNGKFENYFGHYDFGYAYGLLLKSAKRVLMLGDVPKVHNICRQFAADLELPSRCKHAAAHFHRLVDAGAFQGWRDEEPGLSQGQNRRQVLVHTSVVRVFSCAHHLLCVHVYVCACVRPYEAALTSC